DDLNTIVLLGRTIAKEFTANGILCSGKHFPGHGDTSEDSHMQLAVVHADRQTLRARELAPFMACAPHLPSILLALICFQSIDKERISATLSPNVVAGLLREELGYGGFLITDDMPNMKEIVANWGLPEAAVRSITAGIDHVLMCGTAEQLTAVHAALMK